MYNSLLTYRILRSNIITHRLLSGDYTEVCPWLVSALASRGLWTEDIRVAILRRHGACIPALSRTARRLTSCVACVIGSVRDIAELPLYVKELFMTAWEIDPKVVIDMAVDRAPFIDQTQSMSLSVPNPTSDILVRIASDI